MDYNNIFKNYELIKNKINKLLNSVDRDYVKNELDKIKDTNLKKIVKCQYLYLFQKKMNLLKHNKSLLILQLESNIKNLENKKIKEIMKILNKLGYVDLTLLLLNIPGDLLEQIKVQTNNNKITYNILEETSENVDLDKLIINIAEKVLEEYKKELTTGNNNVNIIYKTKNKYKIDKKDMEEEDMEEDMEEEDMEEKDMEEDMEEEDEDEEEDEEEEEEENYNEEFEENENNMKKMQKIIPTFMDKEEETEVDSDEKDENGNTKKLIEKNSKRLVLSKNDLHLLNNLEK